MINQQILFGTEYTKQEDTSNTALLAGIALMSVGIDFSNLSDIQLDNLNNKKIVDMFMDENYRRWNFVRGIVGDIAVDLKQNWQDVEEARPYRRFNVIGSILHYMITLDEETRHMGIKIKNKHKSNTI